MRSLQFSVSGLADTNFFVEELANGSLQFTVSVDTANGDIGDIRAIFLDFRDDALLDDNLVITGAEVTDTKVKAASIDTIGQDANVKGEIVNAFGKYDLGIEIGTSGMSEDDIQTTTFNISYPGVDLDIDQINWQDFAVRMTSVGKAGGPRSESLKVGITTTAAPDAQDDAVFLNEDQEITPAGAGVDYPNLLTNDQIDWVDPGDIYEVETVAGTAANVGTPIAVMSSNGVATQLTVYADGTMEFDPRSDFNHLALGESDEISLGYGVYDNNGGRDAAQITLTINGQNDAPILVGGDIEGAVYRETSLLGVRIVGEAAGDRLGWGISTAGDANGDGFDDVLVGAFYNSDGGFRAGKAYVIYGQNDLPSAIDAADIGGSVSGVNIIGENTQGIAGYSVDLAGDINNDGIDDLIVGANTEPAGGAFSGSAYVIFGTAGGLSDVYLSDIASGIGGFKIRGENFADYSARNVIAAGDVNGDGIDDVAVGAVYQDGGGFNSGAEYVIFGSASPPASVNLDNIAAGIGGFKITGETSLDAAGESAAAIGDINGDGRDDLLIGSPQIDENGKGATYVVFGTNTANAVNLDNVAVGVGGYKIVGEANGDAAGYRVASADLNNDGFADLLIGAQFNDATGSNSGAAYVVFGTASQPTGPIYLSDVANGIGGFKISGEAAGDRAGSDVAVADVNGDGIEDALIGALANQEGGASAGAAYVIFGSGGLGSAISLNDIAAGSTDGFKMVGAAGDGAGSSVSEAGDVNGDGFADLLVGAYLASDKGTGSGAAYIVYGSASGSAKIDLAELETTQAGTAGGQIAFGDPDDSDTHTTSFVENGGGYVGTFQLSPINQLAGTLDWTFYADPAVMAALSPGAVLVQSYGVTINDGNGGMVTETVDITLYGDGSEDVFAFV